MVDPDSVSRYHLAPLHEIHLVPGGLIAYGSAGNILIQGTILEVAEEARLFHTFRFSAELPGTQDEPETTVAYHLAREHGGTLLTLSHSGFPSENQTYHNIAGGWPHILAGMKTFLETDPPE